MKGKQKKKPLCESDDKQKQQQKDIYEDVMKDFKIIKYEERG